MDAITVLDDVVNQLTDSFRRADSVNYLYRACRKIVEAKIVETEGFDFSRMLTWLDEIKARCHKGKYKCIERIVYGLNDYLNHREFSSTIRFVYPNDNSQFRKTSKASQQIISDYVSKSRRCSPVFQSYLKSCIGYYFLFLERNNLDYKNISYDDIFQFRDYISSLKLSCQSTKKILNTNAEFIYDTGADLKTRIGSLILRTTHANYIEKISAIQHDVLCSFDLTIAASIDYDRIPLFFEELKRKKYTVKSQSHSKRIAYELLFFSFRYNIPLTFGNTFLWAKFVCGNIVYDLEYRSFGIKFVEFLQKGTFAYLNSFFDSPKSSPHIRKRQIDNIPSWSKPMVDKYLAYRRNLGYRTSTLCMDCNSIYRFITFISGLGIGDYSSVKLEHVLSFASSDAHTTAEGRNAYITRVKGFLVFLKDNDVINLYIDSRIIGRFRNKKKLIKIISEDDILRITSREYTNSSEIRAYAIFLLGIKCGLRSIDIVNLKFGDISFRDRTLKIVQIKTGKKIVLPIPVIALNAIYDYVKNVRPESSSEYIFVSFHVPFEKLSRRMCEAAFDMLKKRNGIAQDKYRGFHICRKTYASSIINRTKDIDITAYSLGHSDNSTVDDYISIDTSNMHECPLGLKDIGYGVLGNGSL